MKVYVNWNNNTVIGEKQYKKIFESEKRRLHNLECVLEMWLESPEGCVSGDYNKWLTEYTEKNCILNEYEEVEVF